MSGANSNNLIEIGYLHKLHGIKGEVQLNLKDGIYSNLIEENGWIFIKINGEFIPFFVLEFYEKNPETLVLNLEDIYSLEQAENIIKNPVFVQIDEHEKNLYLPKEEIFEAYKGFEGVTKSGTSIGILNEIEHSPTNPLLIFKKGIKKISIPVYSDFIDSVNRDSKKIILDLPDGYLEVF